MGHGLLKCKRKIDKKKSSRKERVKKEKTRERLPRKYKTKKKERLWRVVLKSNQRMVGLFPCQ